jgi:glycosyltransferase involved in cell wall biosynthesis
MAKRIKLGLIFSIDENWIGGTYYILNLIKAIGTLSENEQPEIVVLSKNFSDFKEVQLTNYKHLVYHNPYNFRRNIFEALINKIVKIFIKKDIIDKRISEKEVDVLFPATNDPCFSRISNKVFWFPDFQHLYYPEFFNQEALELRNSIIRNIAKSKNKLVLSSKDAKSNFDLINIEKKCTTYVVPFAVTHPSITSITFESLLSEYSINPRYFIVCNQFWKHKNHFVLLKAALLLKNKGINFQFVFTGNVNDYRNPHYFQSIMNFIQENQLEEFIKILGMIERIKQLALIKFSIALIQPSLFEGWSTVIEDAKSIGKFIIASDINVHKEQLNNNADFFEAENEYEFADKIEKYNNIQFDILSNDYNSNIKLFGKQFLDVIK